MLCAKHQPLHPPRTLTSVLYVISSAATPACAIHCSAMRARRTSRARMHALSRQLKVEASGLTPWSSSCRALHPGMATHEAG